MGYIKHHSIIVSGWQIKELKEIIYNHECHLESALSDALSSLSKLFQKL